MLLVNNWEPIYTFVSILCFHLGIFWYQIVLETMEQCIDGEIMPILCSCIFVELVITIILHWLSWYGLCDYANWLVLSSTFAPYCRAVLSKPNIILIVSSLYQLLIEDKPITLHYHCGLMIVHALKFSLWAK